jgi:predicted TIM-barrel fold metal-dependent hydrolase
MSTEPLSIVTCHAHFLDAEVHTKPVFSKRSPGFEALVGDYSALPRRYLAPQYLEDVSGFNVTQIVSAEFISTDPVREVRWAEDLSAAKGILTESSVRLISSVPMSKS